MYNAGEYVLQNSVCNMFSKAVERAQWKKINNWKMKDKKNYEAMEPSKKRMLLEKKASKKYCK